MHCQYVAAKLYIQEIDKTLDTIGLAGDHDASCIRGDGATDPYH